MYEHQMGHLISPYLRSRADKAASVGAIQPFHVGGPQDLAGGVLLHGERQDTGISGDISRRSNIVNVDNACVSSTFTRRACQIS